jgi:UPF0716 protein FxsA
MTRTSMLRWLPVALLTGLLVEVAVFLAVARALGAGWAMLAAALVSVTGGLLLRREGMRAWRRFRTAADSGQRPGTQVSDGVVGLAGALLLAAPGFVSSAVGLLVLVPPVRALARRRVQRFAERRLSSAAAGDLFGPRRVRVRRGEPVPEPTGPEPAGPVQPGAAIEGEIVDSRP